MTLSTRVRYGVRLMAELGLHRNDDPVLLKDMSRNQGISGQQLGWIIIPRKAAGLVRTRRGAHGGYRFGRQAADIALENIVELLDGDMRPPDCVRDPDSRAGVSRCATGTVWKGFGNAYPRSSSP